MAGESALGSAWAEVRVAIQGGRSGVREIETLRGVEGLRTAVAAPVTESLDLARHPRKKLRSMGRVARLAASAAEAALTDAGLLGAPEVSDGTLGLAFGSGHGSPPAAARYVHAFVVNRSTRGASPIDFLQMMSHTCAANLAQLFGVRGAVLPTCSACAAGSQALGLGLDRIRSGRQALVLAGGAEELHEVTVAIFDMLQATSTRTEATPRPFDRGRDGLVVGEGAGALVLEELGHARRRGARIHAELLGYGESCDGSHLTLPDPAGMRRAMEVALADAGVAARDVAYVNAHATATDAGDIAEAEATNAVFGDRVPVSSLKGHLGHTLGACGALEAWITLAALGEGWLPPTLHLDEPDPRCAPLDHVRGAPRGAAGDIAVVNKFAFGGINTSLVFRRWREERDG